LLKKILSFAFLLFYASYASNFCFADKESEATIILPGIFSSGLFYRGESDSDRYSVNEAIWLPVNDQNFWRQSKGILKFRLFYEDLFLNRHGKLKDDNIGLSLENKGFPHQVDAEIVKYGVGNSYKELIKSLEKKFPSHKIIFFNYDWRTPDGILERLKKITKQYEKINIVAFSFGGLIGAKFIAEYLRNGKNNVIGKVVFIAVPQLGSAVTFHVLEKGFPRNGPDFSGMGKVISLLSRCCPTTICLLPNEKYFELSQGYVINDYGKKLNYKETMDLIKHRFKIRFMDKYKSFHDDLIIDGKNVLNFYDYYLIAGSGIKTPSEITISSNELDGMKITGFANGDGTVMCGSAIPFEAERDRVTKISKVEHNRLPYNKKVIEKIISIIGSKIEKKHEELDPAA
jgi:hypothetical protein